MVAKILIAEDDTALAGMVRDYFVARNYLVDHVTTGTDALSWLLSNSYSVAIVDWELPSLNGPDICNQYRGGGGKTPILMLTGRDSTNDIVEGLESGADDYLAKPFQLPVLMARLRALIRRTGTSTKHILTAGSIELDTEKGQVHKDGEEIVLQRKEFAVLEFLMRNPGKVYSPNAILDHIWATDAETTVETLRSHMTRLRAKLAAVGESGLIKTVYGMGYKLETGS
jgi:DNA-binding response OmpR family regulator